MHHLTARIPNYRVRTAYEQQPMSADTPVVTVRGGMAALRLKLCDEERGCLVGYPARPRGGVGRSNGWHVFDWLDDRRAEGSLTERGRPDGEV